jgi:Heterokaryon incompatibility protein (HET)
MCINQDENSPEKGHQVGLMDRIYKSAKRVLIWLGTANNTTAVVFEYFRVMAAVATRFIPYDLEKCWTEDIQLSSDLNELDFEELSSLAKLGLASRCGRDTE